MNLTIDGTLLRSLRGLVVAGLLLGKRTRDGMRGRRVSLVSAAISCGFLAAHEIATLRPARHGARQRARVKKGGRVDHAALAVAGANFGAEGRAAEAAYACLSQIAKPSFDPPDPSFLWGGALPIDGKVSRNHPSAGYGKRWAVISSMEGCSDDLRKRNVTDSLQWITWVFIFQTGAFSTNEPSYFNRKGNEMVTGTQTFENWQADYSEIDTRLTVSRRRTRAP